MARMRKILQWVVVIASAVMIVSGLLRDEYREILSRAVMICMECIGIG